MTLKEACFLIGVSEDAPASEVKTKYRQLMHKYHPDAIGTEGDLSNDNAIKAALINEAYDILLKRKPVFAKTQPAEERESNKAAWNAPIVETAYEMREILQPVEDANGNVYANICVARGKFVWTADEDFKLFMLSIYNLSRSILDREDVKLRRYETVGREAFQAELAYLLARQFINGTESLKFILGDGTMSDDGLTLYLVKGMLEKVPGAKSPGRAEFLYPEKVLNHRLYLKNSYGKSIGYLSFQDNRLYYILVPLFEERRAQVMIMQNPEMYGRNNNTDLIVWIKILNNTQNAVDIDVNLKIDKLIKMYSADSGMI